MRKLKDLISKWYYSGANLYPFDVHLIFKPRKGDPYIEKKFYVTIRWVANKKRISRWEIEFAYHKPFEPAVAVIAELKGCSLSFTIFPKTNSIKEPFHQWFINFHQKFFYYCDIHGNSTDRYWTYSLRGIKENLPIEG